MFIKEVIRNFKKLDWDQEMLLNKRETCYICVVVIQWYKNDIPCCFSADALVVPVMA